MDERIRQAQEKLDFAIKKLNLNIRCEVMNHKDDKFPTQFFTRENKLIIASNIHEDWIEDTNIKEDFIDPKLQKFLTKINRRAKRIK